MDCYNVLLYIKMSDRTTYYQRNRERTLNWAKEYQNNKDVLREKARNKYRWLFEEGKNEI